MTEASKMEQLSSALAELDEPRVLELVDEIATESPEEAGLAIDAVQAGMDEVGQRYQDGEYFLAEMIFAAEVVRQAMPRLTEVMAAGERKTLGKVVLGTVKGDLHDIGKNLIGVMMGAVGFEVVDLGIDVPPQRFVKAIQEQKPLIVGLSGLLTLSVEAMVETVDAIKEAGVRDQVKVIIGGNPVTEHIHGVVGSDAWTNNAAEGLEICQKWAEV